MSESGQNPNLPRRSIAVRFTLNKQTPTGGVQYESYVRLPAVSTCSKAASLYSITSSARASSVSGTVRPSAFAALRLITNEASPQTDEVYGRLPNILVDSA
jgi:hypothetical protein